MKPNIIKVQFLEGDNDRRILCTLSDGGKVKIAPLNSFGEESFEQYNATLVQMQVTQPLAERSMKWLHGHTDKVPSVKDLVKPPKNFVNKINALHEELISAIAALLDVAEGSKVSFVIEDGSGLRRYLADVGVGSKDDGDIYPNVKEIYKKKGKVYVALDNAYREYIVPIDDTDLSTDDLATINDTLLHLLGLHQGHTVTSVNTYPRYGLTTWPRSQDFVGNPECILVRPNGDKDLDSAYLVPENIKGPLDKYVDHYLRIPYPESQEWNCMPKEYGILHDYRTKGTLKDAFVPASLYKKITS